MAQPLLPERHSHDDLFICDFANVIPKNDIASMEHPLFTLSTKPDKKIRHYEHNGNTATIVPSTLGLATIHDKDILIYIISQLIKGSNQGAEPRRKVSFKARHLLITTNRQTSGQGYKLLRNALDRLAGTLIKTNIKTNGKQIIEGFGIIDSYKIVVDDPKTNRMVELEVTLSEWLYNSLVGKEILTLNSDYFRLRKPIERRIYELARKHCGQQNQWKIGVKNLHKKVGSTAALRKFKESLNHIVKHNHLPDYSIRIETGIVIFSRNTQKKAISKPEDTTIQLKPQTIKNAKKIIGQHDDIAVLERDWKEWWESTGKPKLTSPDGAFINFCKKRMEANSVTPSTTQQTKRLKVPNMRDGTQLQNWAIANGLPGAPAGFETLQYYRLLCNHVERMNLAQEREE